MKSGVIMQCCCLISKAGSYEVPDFSIVVLLWASCWFTYLMILLGDVLIGAVQPFYKCVLADFNCSAAVEERMDGSAS